MPWKISSLSELYGRLNSVLYFCPLIALAAQKSCRRLWKRECASSWSPGTRAGYSNSTAGLRNGDITMGNGYDRHLGGDRSGWGISEGEGLGAGKHMRISEDAMIISTNSGLSDAPSPRRSHTSGWVAAHRELITPAPLRRSTHRAHCNSWRSRCRRR